MDLLQTRFKQSDYLLDKSLLFSQQTVKLIRFFLSIYMLLVIYGVNVTDPHPYLFFTVYGYTFNTAYFGLITIETTFFKGKSVYLWRFLGVLFQISFNMEFVIVLMYWVILYPIEVQQGKIRSDWQNFLNYNVHGSSYVFILFEYLHNTFIVKKKDLLFVLIVTILYGCLNMTYVLTYDKLIYPIFTWTDYETYIYLAVILVVILVHHMIIGEIIANYKVSKILKLKEEKEEQQDLSIRWTFCNSQL